MDDVLTPQVRAVRRLGHYFVERLRHLERQFRDPRQGSEQALAEFDAEWSQLQHTFEFLAPLLHGDTQIAEICRQLPMACTSIFLVRFSGAQRVAWLQVSVEATKQLREWRLGPTPEFELRLYGELGNAFLACQQFRSAERIYQNAVTLARSIEDPSAEALWLGNRAVALAELRQFKQAILVSEQSAQRAQATGSKRLYGDQLRLLGTIYIDLGNFRRALQYLFRALAVHAADGHTLEVSSDLGEIGLALKMHGDLVRAKRFLTDAWETSRRLGHEQSERTWRMHLQGL